MKPSTAAIAFGPALLVLCAKFAIEPTWLSEWSLPACLALGAAIGVFGAMAARVVEPRD
ncbi:MAG: hypothetical protein O9327_03295 [Polaromonas sp.]|nr:hypothetical protein [Polaromonas sp.]